MSENSVLRMSSCLVHEDARALAEVARNMAGARFYCPRGTYYRVTAAEEMMVTDLGPSPVSRIRGNAYGFAIIRVGDPAHRRYVIGSGEEIFGRHIITVVCMRNGTYDAFVGQDYSRVPEETRDALLSRYETIVYHAYQDSWSLRQEIGRTWRDIFG